MNGTSLEARVQELEIKLAARDAWLTQLHIAVQETAEMLREAKNDTDSQIQQMERIARIVARIEERLREDVEE